MARRDPVVVIVADAHGNGNARLEGHLPAQVTVHVGQELHVNARYRVTEKGAQREEYRFRLVSTIGTQRPAPSEVRWKDTPLKPDDGSGFVGHRFVFDRPGVYEGEVQITAQYGEGRWFGRMQTVEQAQKSGTIRVQVVE